LGLWFALGVPCAQICSTSSPHCFPRKKNLSITLRQRLKALAGGLMPRVVFEKLATLQLLDVRLPTTDGRELLLVRRTEPDRDVALLLDRLNLVLPPQAPPRISAAKTN
jgi:hypothetical protein